MPAQHRCRRAGWHGSPQKSCSILGFRICSSQGQSGLCLAWHNSLVSLDRWTQQCAAADCFFTQAAQLAHAGHAQAPTSVLISCSRAAACGDLHVCYSVPPKNWQSYIRCRMSHLTPLPAACDPFLHYLPGVTCACHTCATPRAKHWRCWLCPACSLSVTIYLCMCMCIHVQIPF